jgi:hypothetical protein
MKYSRYKRKARGRLKKSITWNNAELSGIFKISSRNKIMAYKINVAI